MLSIIEILKRRIHDRKIKLSHTTILVSLACEKNKLEEVIVYYTSSKKRHCESLWNIRGQFMVFPGFPLSPTLADPAARPVPSSVALAYVWATSKRPDHLKFGPRRSGEWKNHRWTMCAFKRPLLMVYCWKWLKPTQPIGSIKLVYLPAWTVDFSFYGKCM